MSTKFFLIPLWIIILYTYPFHIKNHYGTIASSNNNKTGYYEINIDIIEDFPGLKTFPSPLKLTPGGRLLKIGLYKDMNEVNISCEGNFTICNKKEDLILQKNQVLSIKVKELQPSTDANKTLPAETITTDSDESDETIKIKPEGLCNFLTIITKDTDGNYTEKRYRGTLEVFINSSGKLTIVNQLSLNEYLGGVVPSEMPSFYPIEALKAQSIAARTYTLKNLGDHKKDGFDLCATTHCQAYGGVENETSGTNQAVMETIHQIVYYNNQLADTVYHSTCGGITANVENVWESAPVNYLISVPDKKNPEYSEFPSEEEFQKFITSGGNCYCQQSSMFRWEKTYTFKEMTDLFAISIPVILKNPAIKINKILDITIENRAKDGRVTTLLIKTDAEEYRIKKDSIRWLFSGGKIGKNGLSSTLFYIYKPDKDTCCFKGGGWGHGIGLCQVGAKGMAENGYSTEEIIQYYYPGTKIGAPLWYHKQADKH